MANFNEGDSRHDLNYPEIPNSWNNKEKTKMAKFKDKINFGTGFVLCDPDNYFIYRSDSMRMFAQKIYDDLHSREDGYRLVIQYKTTHRVKKLAGHCFLWSLESANNGNVEVRMLDRTEDCEGIVDPRLDSIEGAIFIRDRYVYMYGDTRLDAVALKKEYVICDAFVCGRLGCTFRIPAEVFDRCFGLKENFPEQYEKQVEEEKDPIKDPIEEVKRSIELLKDSLWSNKRMIERAVDLIKCASIDIEDMEFELDVMLSKLTQKIGAKRGERKNGNEICL